MLIPRRNFLRLASGATAAMAIPTVPALLLDGPSSLATNWQANAAAILEKIYEGRLTDTAYTGAFTYGDSRLYFTASSNRLGLPQSSLFVDVHDSYLPNGIITTSQIRLLEQFGFKLSVGKSGKAVMYWIDLPIRRDSDLTPAARFAYQVLAEIYGVRDFAATQYQLTIPPYDRLGRYNVV